MIKFSLKKNHAFILAIIILGFGACNNDDDSAPAGTKPNFALLTGTLDLRAGEEGACYLMTLSNLNQPTTLNNAAGIELPAFSAIRTYEGDIYVYNLNTALLRKFKLDEKGLAQPAGQLDIEEFGTGINDIEFISPTKAYIAINASSIIEFNPSDMTFTQAINFGTVKGLDKFKDLRVVALEMIVRNTELFFSVFVRNAAFEASSNPDSIMVMSVNTNTNEILDLAIKNGVKVGGDNSGAESMFVDANGDLYVHSHGFWEAETTTPTALVRIPRGSRQFDDYFWNLTQACGNRKTIHVYYSSATTAYTKAWYPQPVEGGGFYAAAHRWWKLDFSTKTAVEMAVPGFTAAYWSQVALGDGNKFYFPMSDLTNILYEYDPAKGEASNPAAFQPILTLDLGVVNGIEKF